jgi:hypothetical protein
LDNSLQLHGRVLWHIDFPSMRSSLREALERRDVTSNQCLLFFDGPAFQLSFAADGGEFIIECLGVDKPDWAAAGRPNGTLAVVMSLDSVIKVRR